MRELHALNDLEEYTLLVHCDLFTYTFEKDPGWLLASVPTEAYSIMRVNERIYFYFHLKQFLSNFISSFLIAQPTTNV